ncbi:T9SS type B sorting domain-containing protein [Pareuzebyella sediminis]|uniref:T9SS type B sorting domain-containing protein n=1 Tax=Pareuzebyella sediminis TaxID=2607998 RepID=UPI002939158D|nr:T9SS type B sorting domain-containing protein [Pareuzebyella sediminis]
MTLYARYIVIHNIKLEDGRAIHYFYLAPELNLLMKYSQIFLYLVLFLSIGAKAQVSADCSNAVPICNDTPVNGGTMGFGVDDFGGAATSGCLEVTLSGSIESNSAWYRFRTGASGQLGFNIGIDTTEDWDFALYMANDCNNLGEPVRCNFFDNQDENRFIGVGEDPSGESMNVQYEDWLQVSPGEEYYLLINNFSNSNSGFSIQFSGQIFVTNPYDALDCSIISNLLGPPVSACEGSAVILDATTSNATTYNWFVDQGSGFTQIVGSHNETLQALSAGQYRVEVVRPSGNIISEVQVAFSPMPIAHSVADDFSCSGEGEYDLAQKDIEVLGSQAASEYIVSYYGSLIDANSGINFLSKQFMPEPGTQTIFVRLTSVNNPKCYDTSQSFQLINLDTPVINFPIEEFLCQSSSVTIGDTSPNLNYSYSWDTGDTTPSIEVSQAGSYSVTVTHTQSGFSCSTTQVITVLVSLPLNIMDIEIDDLKNNNTVTVITESPERFEYQLDGGAFQKGNRFYGVEPGAHRITVNDLIGCGAVSEDIVVVGFPRFFTPNGDGSNDFWNITGIDNLVSPTILIYDRFGKLLAQLGQGSSGWDGTLNGKPLPETDYWFKLTYTNDNGQTNVAKYVNNHFALKR